MIRVFAAALSLSLLACGVSPILHHATASLNQAAPASPDRAPVGRPDQSPCPIELTKSGLCASISWVSAPSAEAENAFTLRLWDRATGSPAGPYRDASGDLAVQLWMPAMGHGSSPVTLTRSEAGVYQVTRVYFVMTGHWEVRILVRRDHQLFDQASQGVDL